MGSARGFDGGKKLAGRKRHIPVDTHGFLLAEVVQAANIPDRQGGKLVLDAMGKTFPRLQRIWADQGYTGALIPWAGQKHRCTSRWSTPRFANSGDMHHTLPRIWATSPASTSSQTLDRRAHVFVDQQAAPHE